MVRFESNIPLTKEQKEEHAVKSVHVQEFSMESKKAFIEECDVIVNSGQKVLPVVIDSYGGGVYALLGMMDYLDSLKGVEVITICNGVAMSCGAALFTCGKRRYITPNGTVLFHDMSWGAIGKDTDIQADAKNSERIKKVLYHTISTNLGYDKNWLHEELLKRGNADWSLTAKESKKLNVATSVGLPTFLTKIKVTKEILDG